MSVITRIITTEKDLRKKCYTGNGSCDRVSEPDHVVTFDIAYICVYCIDIHIYLTD